MTNIPAIKRKLRSLENGQFSNTVTRTNKKNDWECDLGQLGLEKGFMPCFQNDKAFLTDMMHGNPYLRAPKYSILKIGDPANRKPLAWQCSCFESESKAKREEVLKKGNISTLNI